MATEKTAETEETPAAKEPRMHIMREVTEPGGTEAAPLRRRKTPKVLKEMRAATSELEMELMANIGGEVRFDDGSKALYTTDGSNYRQIPLGVVVPLDKNDVIKTVELCRKHSVPITMRGGGTALAGQTCNEAVIIDMSKYMNQILELNPQERYARVQPGIILDSLRAEAEKHNLTFGPDPATHTHCTLGGMIGNNSCGIHSVYAGKTVDNVIELEILTYDGLQMWVGQTSDEELQRIIDEGGRRGEVYSKLKDLRDEYADLIRERYPKIPRRVSGYNLTDLLPEAGFDVAKALVGSESTCVIVLEAKLRLVESPPARSLLVLGYEDVYTAGDHIHDVLDTKPLALEGIDDLLIRDMKKKGLHPEDVVLLPEGGGWLLLEYGGETKEESDAHAKRLMDELKKRDNPPSMKLFDDPVHEKMVWTIRESGLGATALVPGEDLTWEGWEDSAVPPDKVGDYLRDLRQLLDKFGYRCDLYGHFGQGCIHTRIDFDFFTSEGIAHYRHFMEEATDLIMKYGGSFSGEHGDGQSRAEFLPKMFGPELVEAFNKFKTIWDPEWRMNPGKVVKPYRIDQNLRLGTHYNPPQPKTYFQFPDDHGSFADATLRCVGVGECRRLDKGTMCPSFMVTREEKHTTRGRAHSLFEMLQGDVLSGGWKDENAKESLDLCLSCKGCKGDCPVNVDLATYKAEFLSHYYEGKVRPRHAYAFGLMFKWAKVANFIPGIANFFTHTPGFSRLFKGAIGMAQEREIPHFAPETFRNWFNKREMKNQDRPEVILWPDTWNNYFYPQTAKAAVEVLEAAGFKVTIPKNQLCCGRPLYDYGLLKQAQQQILKILDELGPQIAAGISLVGLEPSCISVFRDEMIGLFPNNENAKRLSQQAYMLTDFLEKYAKDFELPKVNLKALVHGHCHHKAVLKLHAEEEVIKKMGLDYEILDSGCCGMAGAFGFEKDHYEVSMACGERVLIPAVRNADKDTVVITDGFSCREQICQTTERRGLHTAEVIQLAMQNELSQDGEYPEAKLVQEKQDALKRMNRRTSAILGAGAAIVGIAYWQSRKRRAK